MMFADKVLLVLGGTGSLGQALVRRLLSGEQGKPRKVIVFSRDEAKQHEMRLAYLHQPFSTDEVILDNFRRSLEFRIGDVRDLASLREAMRGVDYVFHAAALKQVPTCEYFPEQALKTNAQGAELLVQAAIEEQPLAVVGLSTDKACQPVNVMGMTKALQERILVAANLRSAATRFLNVRYGNVLASRGSMLPLFREQIRRGGPVTLTHSEMTRFFLSLDQAVDCIFAALAEASPGEIYVPHLPSARIAWIAEALCKARNIPIIVTGVRPGEKIHEQLVSVEEGYRTMRRGDYLVIQPALPELVTTRGQACLNQAYCSSQAPMNRAETLQLLEQHGYLKGSPTSAELATGTPQD